MSDENTKPDATPDAKTELVRRPRRSKEELLALTLKVLELIEKGVGPTTAAAQLDIQYHVVLNCCDSDPNLKTRLLNARRHRADFLADEIKDIADGDDNPHKARNRIDARRWLASKLNAAVYGDKIDIQVSAAPDLSGALESARKRATSVIVGHGLDNVVTEVQSLESPASNDSELDDMLS